MPDMDRLRQDLRFALRSLRRAPAFSIVIVLTLGLGIGANTAIFSLMDQVLLRMLPVRAPQELVLLNGPGPFSGRTMNSMTLDQMTFYVRTRPDVAGIPAAVRQVVQRLDSNLPIFDMKSMEAQVDESLFLERLVASLSMLFGGLATVLAAVGLYGVMSYTVSRRTREIGIRMALGAARTSVLWMVLREVALMAATGIVLGLPAAIGLSRFVESQLYGLSPTDPATLAAAAAVLSGVAMFAGYLPARRATRVDPMLALRYE